MPKILLGRIRDAHGIRGEVKLLSFTSEPDAIASYGPLETASGRVIEIARLRPASDHFIATLKGITSRNDAELLKGADLFIDREKLPAAEEDEVYAADLIGLPVHLKDGTVLGEIVSVQNFGAGDLLEVRIEGRKDTVLIPYAEAYVIAEDAGKLTVDLPEGWLDAE